MYEDDDFDGDDSPTSWQEEFATDEDDSPDHVEPNGDDEDDRSMFANPGGNSSLRAATRSNPRNLPCPTCERPNRLTPKDRALGYQCDSCADQDEGGF